MWKNKNCEFRIPLTHDNQVWTCGGNWEVGTRTTGSKYSLRKKKERYCLVTTQIIWVSDVLLTTNKVKGLKWLSLTLLPFINFPCEMKGEINAPHPPIIYWVHWVWTSFIFLRGPVFGLVVDWCITIFNFVETCTYFLYGQHKLFLNLGETLW